MGKRCGEAWALAWTCWSELERVLILFSFLHEDGISEIFQPFLHLLLWFSWRAVNWTLGP